MTSLSANVEICVAATVREGTELQTPKKKTLFHRPKAGAHRKSVGFDDVGPLSLRQQMVPPGHVLSAGGNLVGPEPLFHNLTFSAGGSHCPRDSCSYTCPPSLHPVSCAASFSSSSSTICPCDSTSDRLGPKNLMRSLELLRGLPKQVQRIVQPVIYSNAYWEHPKAVLLSVVADENTDVPARSVQSSRRPVSSAESSRRTRRAIPYLSLQVNFQATTNTDQSACTGQMAEPSLATGLCVLVISGYPPHSAGGEQLSGAYKSRGACCAGGDRSVRQGCRP